MYHVSGTVLVTENVAQNETDTPAFPELPASGWPRKEKRQGISKRYLDQELADVVL